MILTYEQNTLVQCSVSSNWLLTLSKVESLQAQMKTYIECYKFLATQTLADLTHVSNISNTNLRALSNTKTRGVLIFLLVVPKIEKSNMRIKSKTLDKWNRRIPTPRKVGRKSNLSENSINFDSSMKKVFTFKGLFQ